MVENARPAAANAFADVVEKKKPLSMPLRNVVESVVVPTTLPCAFVERRAFAVLVMARLVVVAPVAVKFVAKRLVEVALVEVEIVEESAKILEDAFKIAPMVVVGVSAPPRTFQSPNWLSQ